MSWERLEVGGGCELNMGAGRRRQDAFAADFSACKGDAGAGRRFRLKSVGERETSRQSTRRGQ